MPRRRQGHFHAIKKAEKLKGQSAEDGIGRYARGYRSKIIERKIEREEEEDEALNESVRRYSHKKFKKMETTTEEEESSLGGVHQTPANLSLEALFQVTGHELEKIKLSSQDSQDSSEQCAATREKKDKEQNEEEEKEEEGDDGKLRKNEKKRRTPDATELRNSSTANSEAEDPGASKRLRLGRHACPFCGLGCGKPSVLEKHIRAHTNERPYPCIPCGFSFKTKSNLYKHRKSRAHHLKVSDDLETNSEKRADRDSRPRDEETTAIIDSDESSNSYREGEEEEDDDDEDDDDVKDEDRTRRSLPSDKSGGDEGVIKEASSHAESNFPSTPPPPSLLYPRTFPVSTTASGVSSVVVPTSIYKPKFHSVPFDVLSSRRCEDSETEGPLLVIPNEKFEGETRRFESGVAEEAHRPISKRAYRAAPANGGLDAAAAAAARNAISLAKRRNDQFQLRLEIPRPPPPPPAAPLPTSSSLSSSSLASSSSSSSSSSSCSTSLRSRASSPAVSALTHHPDSSRLPVSVVASATTACHSSSGCQNEDSLRRNLKSPALASPEYLQQRISKLISQNAAIVETLDPLWPRRYTRQNSVASSHNVDAEIRGGSKERSRRFSEDVASSFPSSSSSKSKLASALLANVGKPSASEASSARAPSLGLAVKGPRHQNDHDQSKKESDASSGGSIVRSLLLVDHAKRSDLSKKKEEEETLDPPHPQNPEGSIIKDLLLKTRSAGRSCPSLATCMRLSGGSVSARALPSEVDVIRVCSSSSSPPPPPREASSSSFLPGEYQQRNAVAVYSCSSCNISYRKPENLEVHRSRYCPNHAVKVVTTATSGGSFILPAADGIEDLALVNASGIACHEASAPNADLLCQKPRGRPRGSKNRPKMEAAAAVAALPGARSVSKALPPPLRTHSKSISESSGEMLVTRDKTIDALKGKLRYRRNSVSGVASPKPLSGVSSGLASPSSCLYAEEEAEEKTFANDEREGFESWRTERSIHDGPILKKHLLGGDKSPPPPKKRKGSADIKADAVKSNGTGSTVLTLKSLEHLSKYPMRPSAIHLFGGEVQICDGAETKKIVIDNNNIQSLSSAAAFLGGIRTSDSTTSSVVATIAKPVHNSGGTVLLQVQDSKVSLVNKPVCIPAVSIGRPLMATGSAENARTSLAGAIVLRSPESGSAAHRPFGIDISHLQLLKPNPILERSLSSDSSVLLLPPRAPLQSPDARFYSHAAASEGEEGAMMSTPTPTPTTDDGARARDVPLIAIHSPRSPSVSGGGGGDIPLPAQRVPESSSSATTSLTLTRRPTTLALKKTNASSSSSVGMTLVSPETPRPKKKYGQCYHNGQYYTYLEFKQSTRVYYCNCRPQPMYVPQSVDPRLSMYSMWQTVPASPDPFGLSPPQAMSLYRSSEPPGSAIYTVAKPAKTPLVLTHSSYWTFQRQGKDEVTPPLRVDSETTPRIDDGDTADTIGQNHLYKECEFISSKHLRDTFLKLPPRQPTLVEDATSEKVKMIMEIMMKLDAYCEVEAVESDVTSRKALEESEEDDDEGSDRERTSVDERSAAEGASVVEKTTLFKGETTPLKHRLKDTLEIGIHEPKRVKIFEGGFKSNEDYTYVRGRGRGKYVCEECGIRCKKPSMLKKHIRTHTDVRPYTCKHCNFSFKTKGNLTKHMKSKAHHKKCVELGIVPVPVTIDDAQIDEEALARQERIEHQRKQFADVDEDSTLEDDEDEDEDEDDDYYDQMHEKYKEGEDEDDESMELEGQFEDANETPFNKILTVEGNLRKGGCAEQEIARSLLDLGKPEIAVGSPSPMQSSSHFDIRGVKEVNFHQHPTVPVICHDLKVDNGSDDREELIGNPRVAWASCLQNVDSCHLVTDNATRSNVYDAAYESTERNEEISLGSNSRTRVVLINPVVHERNVTDDAPSSCPQLDGFVTTGNNEGCAFDSHSIERRSKDVDSANDDCDQPIDLSMPHSRCEHPEWNEVDDDDEDDVDEGENDDEDEIVVDDEEEEDDVEDEDDDDDVEASEKVGPFYCSYSELEESGRSDGSTVRRGKVAALPSMLQNPSREELSAGNRVVGGNEWLAKRTTSPQCSMLHSYLSDEAPAKRVSIEVVATLSRHRSSVTTFGEKDSFSVALPTTHAPSLGYPASPPSHLDSQHEPSSLKLPPDRMSRLPSTSIRNMPQYIHGSLEDDKCVCTICNKAFNKPSQLRLHVNIHYFERPFRCDSCAISFRTKGHLQKHKRSVSHYNKVNMNMTFGTPTTDNPRPFKCDDCKIAFRIHGHLAKHLRSKMHIMKLECLGKLPFGTYAEIERSGANLNEIDTTDCENSLESLQVMAHRLVDKVAVSHRWPRERTISGGSCDDQSDGVPYAESPIPVVPVVLNSSNVTSCATSVPRQFGSNRSPSEDGCASPDLMDSDHLVTWSRKSFEGDVPALPSEALDAGASPTLPSTIKCEPNEKRPQLPHLINLRAKTVLSAVKQPASSQRNRSVGSLIQEYEDISDEDEAEIESSERNNAVCFACRKCGKRLKSAKFLQLHMYVDHPENAVTTSEVADDRTVESDALSSSSILHSSLKRRKTSSPLLSISVATSTTITGEGLVCQLCGERFTSSHNLKQHTLVHAQFRPFVCDICDAGFTNSRHLKFHALQSHQQVKAYACQQCNLVFGVSEDLQHHISHTHPAIDSDRVR